MGWAKIAMTGLGLGLGFGFGLGLGLGLGLEVGSGLDAHVVRHQLVGLTGSAM